MCENFDMLKFLSFWNFGTPVIRGIREFQNLVSEGFGMFASFRSLDFFALPRCIPKLSPLSRSYSGIAVSQTPANMLFEYSGAHVRLCCNIVSLAESLLWR